MAEEEGVDVKLYIYELTNGLARSMSPMFLGKQIDGIWHTGIVVYGKEFYFGGTGGIETCPPGGTILGAPTRVENMGKTQIPYEMFVEYLRDLSMTIYKPECYHLLEHNCNTFSADISQFLTGNDIPSYITGLPAEVLSTPFGQMIKPFIDSMSVQPSGGHALFDTQEPQTSSQKKECTKDRNTVTPQSAQQNATCPKSMDLEETKIKTEVELKRLSPFVYREEKTGLETWQEVVSSKEFRQIKEIYEYLEASDQSQWSLGRDQLDMLIRLLLSKELDTSLVSKAFQIMQHLVLVEDFLHLLQHDPKKGLSQVFSQFDVFCDDVKGEAIKMISNCCSCDMGCKIVNSDADPGNLKQVTQICVTCLLGDNSPLCEGAASTVYNLVVKCQQLSEDVEVELGSAMFEVLQKDLPEGTEFHILTSLMVFMKRHTELQSLAGLLGVKENLDTKRKQSERVASLCDSVSQLVFV